MIKGGLTPLMAPGAIAVVGATERAGAYGGEVLLNLARLGYPGRVYAVNPRRASVHGVRAVPALEDLDEAPDAVVVAVPAEQAPEIVGRARELGCGGAVVFAAGFAEAGAGALQAQLVAAAGGMPVCGPNGNGIVSLPDRVALWGDPVGAVQAGPVALISQSGNVAVNALASRRALHLHTVVSCGNQAVLDAAGFLGEVAERDGVRSVALYLEDDGDGPRWLEALERCAHAGVGVAVLKAGTSRAGAAAAEAHTGAIAGDARVFRALFEECGAAWAEDPHDLLELAKALAARRATPAGAGGDAPVAVHGDAPVEMGGAVPVVGAGGETPVGAGADAPRAARATPGAAAPRGVAVMTCSGGDSAVAADLAARLGVELPPLAPATIGRLEAVLPEAATAANPLDYTSLLWDDAEALRELIEALGEDPGIGRVLVLFDEYDGHAPILDAVATARVPVMLGSTLPELVPAGGIAGLRSALLCAKTTAADAGRIVALKAQRRARLGRQLSEHEAKERLRAAGIPVVPGALAHDEVEAVQIWRELRVPVAVKTTGVSHKTQAGGVILNLDTEDAVKDAYRRLTGTVLVERMAEPGLELLVAIRRDGLAPVLVVGLGGVHTELLDTATITPLPATDVDPRVADIAHKLARIPGLALIELNPVIVNAHGAVAVDALAYEEEP